MAGDGGRAPDVSEQGTEGIALARRIIDRLWAEALMCDTAMLVDHVAVECRKALDALDADPASVLAALLAEQPDATIAALETLLTTDEAVVEAALEANPAYDAATHDSTRAHWRAIQERALAAACRSLRPKAPKEDRDA